MVHILDSPGQVDGRFVPVFFKRDESDFRFVFL